MSEIIEIKNEEEGGTPPPTSAVTVKPPRNILKELREKQNKKILENPFEYRIKLEKQISDMYTILLNSSSLEFIGSVAYGLGAVLVDKTNSQREAMPLTAYVDGKNIYFTLMGTKSLTTEELIFLVTHEVLHIISDHIARSGNRDRIIANIAQDHVINALCKKLETQRIMKVMDNCVYFEDIDQTHPGIAFEKLYEILIKDKQMKVELVLPLYSQKDKPKEKQESKNDGEDGEENKNSSKSNDKLSGNSQNDSEEKSESGSDGSKKGNNPSEQNGGESSEEGDGKESDEKSTSKGSEPNSSETGNAKEGEVENGTASNQDADGGSGTGSGTGEGTGQGSGGSSNESSGGEFEESNDKIDSLSSNIKSKMKPNPDNSNEAKIDTIELSDGEIQEIIRKVGAGELQVEVTRKDKKYRFNLDTMIEPTEDLDSEEIERRIEDLKTMARATWNNSKNSKSKGDLAGEFVTYLDKIFEIKLPWDKILEEAVLYNVSASGKRTWSEKNIYIRNCKVPGVLPKHRKATVFVCAVDSSGSICDNDLQKFISIVVKASNYYKEILMLVHDYGIQDIIHIKNIFSEDQVFQKVRGIKGRGGTSHKELFDYIEEYNQDNKVSTILFNTDFWSDIEGIYKNYKFMRDHTTIWCLNSDAKVQFDYPVNHETIYI